MMFQGTNQVAANYVADKTNLADLDFFPYPVDQPGVRRRTTWTRRPTASCMSKKAEERGRRASAVLEYIGTG